LRLSHSLSATDSETAVQQTTITPSAAYRWGASDQTSLIFSVAPTNYTSDPVRRVLDRDVTTRIATISHNTLLDGPILPLGVNLRFGLSRTFNNAEGADYDYTGYGRFISVSREFPLRITATLNYTSQRDSYSERNSLAGAGFAFKREDKIDQLNLFVERPIEIFGVENVSAFASWQYLNNVSNISFFDYEQTSINFGISARF
jgi:outer membrane protein assembly factor BamA